MVIKSTAFPTEIADQQSQRRTTSWLREVLCASASRVQHASTAAQRILCVGRQATKVHRGIAKLCAFHLQARGRRNTRTWPKSLGCGGTKIVMLLWTGKHPVFILKESEILCRLAPEIRLSAVCHQCTLMCTKQIQICQVFPRHSVRSPSACGWAE